MLDLANIAKSPHTRYGCNYLILQCKNLHNLFFLVYFKVCSQSLIGCVQEESISKKGNACRSEHFVFGNYHCHIFHFFSWYPSFFLRHHWCPLGGGVPKVSTPWVSTLGGCWPCLLLELTTNGELPYIYQQWYMIMYKLNPLRTLKLKRFVISTSLDPCLMHRCVCIWPYILQNYNYKLHFQKLYIYHIPHVFIRTLAAENLDVCTASWDSNIQLTMVKDQRRQTYPQMPFK